MKWSTERNTLLGFGLALLMVVFLSVLANRNTQQFIETNDWVTHSLQVLEELERTRALVIDAETGQRGYILTGDDSYLQPYLNAEVNMGDRLSSLQALLSDNPEQLARLQSVRVAVEERFTLFENSITTAREEGLEAARQIVLSGRGKALMDQIRADIDQMRQAERQILERRRQEVENSAQLTVITIGLLTISVILLLVIVYWVIDRSINRLKHSQATLKVSEERWRSLVENMPDVITTFDVDGTLSYVNQQSYGPIRREHVIGKKIFELVQPDQRDSLHRMMQHVVENRKPITAEFTSGQSGRHMLSTFAPVIVDDAIVNVIGSSVDISERKRAEEQLKRLNSELQAANKELEAFSYSVSHDLRAPLRSIDGFSLALLEDCEDQLDDEGKSYLRRIRAATQRMGQLIDDLLTLSRVTRSEMKWDDVNLAEIAGKLMRHLQEANPTRKVDVIIQEGLHARGDGSLLRVVLVNLLENSWKFTSKKPEARIEVGSMQKDDEQVFFVRDDGAGFDMAYAHKLFGAFQRLHADEEFKGTGIGLATVQRIIHRHGGRIWAEGSNGQGATFYFTLPASQSPQPATHGG